MHGKNKEAWIKWPTWDNVACISNNLVINNMNNNNYETDICIRNDMLLENAESLAGYKTGPTHLFWKKWKNTVDYFK